MERSETDTFGRVLQVLGLINIALLLLGRVSLSIASAYLTARGF
jgi:hypothetical protein